MMIKWKKVTGTLLWLGGGILIGVFIGNQITRPHSIDDALRQAHEYIDSRCNSQYFAQVDLNIYSQFLLSLAHKRRFILEKEQPDTLEWVKKYTIEMEKPSEYEGGSAEPLDINMRGYYLQLERIDELKKRAGNSGR